MLICLFVRQLSDLIEAEPVSKLERLLYRGLLSAHLPQDIKARLLCFLISSKPSRLFQVLDLAKVGARVKMLKLTNKVL